jgi:hypothetical protein
LPQTRSAGSAMADRDGSATIEVDNFRRSKR